MRKILFLLGLMILLGTVPAEGFTRGAALLDIGDRPGAVEPKPNLYGSDHALRVAGIPYLVTKDLSIALSYSMIVISAPFDSSTFTSEERDRIRAYVRQGGILVSPYNKDRLFFDLFGIAGYREGYARKRIRWDVETGDPALRWFDDPMEITISLGGDEYPYIFRTHAYILRSASPLAHYDDGTVAVCVNHYGAGFVYLMGFSFKDLITRNFLGKSMGAYRTYSNGFEPTTDTLLLFIRSIYTKHLPFACWKKTSPFLSKATFIMTHDLCAKTAVEMMNLFADMEYEMGIVADYDVTTTYTRQEKRPGGGFGGFYNEEEIKKLRRIVNQNHKITSHSVNHFPDFDKLPEGHPGNTKENYKPYFDGERTHGGTVYGEVELSKKLLDEDLAVNVRTFRSGHLLFNDKLYNVLEGSKYAYDSTRSANAVLTNFPFRGLKDRSYEGEISSIYEIPMTISDVIEGFSYDNYLEIAAMWLDIIMRNARNYAPTVLLIHPNRYYKLDAEKWLLERIPPYIYITDIDSFGDFWRARDNFKFWTVREGSRLKIVIPSSSLPVESSQSILVEEGRQLSSVEVITDTGQPVPYLMQLWEEKHLLVHWGFEVVVKRYIEQAWSIKKLVAAIKVKFPYGNPEGFHKFVIYRKVGKEGKFEPIMVFTINDFEKGEYVYYDEDVRMGQYYVYKVVACDAGDRPFAISLNREL